MVITGYVCAFGYDTIGYLYTMCGVCALGIGSENASQAARPSPVGTSGAIG